MIGPHDPSVNPGADDGRFKLDGPRPDDDLSMPSDPRILAFYRWIRAIDAKDHRDGVAASRALRLLGISCVLIGPGGRRGGR